MPATDMHTTVFHNGDVVVLTESITVNRFDSAHGSPRDDLPLPEGTRLVVVGEANGPFISVRNDRDQHWVILVKYLRHA